jgi:hypothetical protein
MSSRGASTSEIRMGRGRGSRGGRGKRGAEPRIGAGKRSCGEEVEGRPRATPTSCLIFRKAVAKKSAMVDLQQIETFLKQIDCENGELLEESYITSLWKLQRSTYLMALLEDFIEKRYMVGGAFDLIRDRAVYDLCRKMTTSRDLTTFQHLSFICDKFFDKELEAEDEGATTDEPLTEDNSS